MEEVRKINKRESVQTVSKWETPQLLLLEIWTRKQTERDAASCRLQILSWGNSEWKDYPPH